VILGETDKDVQDRLAWIKDHQLRYGVPEDIAEGQVRGMASGPLVGTPELLAERLAQVSTLGMSYAILNFPEVAYDRTALTLFTEQVAPALTPLSPAPKGIETTSQCCGPVAASPRPPRPTCHGDGAGVSRTRSECS